MNLTQITGIKLAGQLGPDREQWCLLDVVAARLHRPLVEVWQSYKALEQDERGLSPWSPDLATIERGEPDIIESGIYVHKWWAQMAIWLDRSGIERVEYLGLRRTARTSPYRGQMIRVVKFVHKAVRLPRLHRAFETERRRVRKELKSAI